MTHLAAELISHAVEKVTGSTVVNNHVILLRTLNTAEDGGSAPFFSAGLCQGGPEK